MEFVFMVEGKDYGKLKTILEGGTLDKDSFATVGYTLRESKAMGLKGGNYILYFRAEDSELAGKLKEKLKPVETAKELEGSEKQDIVSKIQAEEDSAASGFGNIFG